MTAQTVEDIHYRTIEGTDLLGRLYRPETSGPTPFIVDAHGGAWGSGDRLNNTIIHEDFVRNGIGGPVADVNYAVRWFKANAASLGVNAGPIGGLGSSSGGQQMGLVAFRPNDELYATADAGLEGSDASLAFFIACWPILDPLARYRMAQETGKDRLVNAHNAYFPDEDAMALGNPFLVVERGEATHKPPMVIVQGAADENVNHDRADMFAAAYRAAGGSVDLHKYDGQPHTFITANPNDDVAKQAIATLRDFVLAQPR
jgi:acetyl esterase